MALPATDTFTASDGTALTTYSSNWSLNSGDFDIQSNALRSNASATECGARWNADTFADDQYSQVVINVLATAGNTGGPAVRLSTSGAATYYGAYANTANCYVLKMNAGTFFEVAAITPPTAGQTLKLAVVGNTLEVFYDDVSQGTWTDTGSWTGSPIASGSAGVSGFGAGDADRTDTWEGGNISSGASVAISGSALTPAAGSSGNTHSIGL